MTPSNRTVGVGLAAAVSVAVVVSSVCLPNAWGEAGGAYGGVVTDLEALIQCTPDLRATIEAALRSQDGCSYNWDGKDLKYFVNFFQKWLTYNPPPWAGPEYIQPFDELANSKGGEVLFNNNVFSSWFISFLDARGDYLKTKPSLPPDVLKGWEHFPGIHFERYRPPTEKEKNGEEDTAAAIKKKEKAGYQCFQDVFLRVPREPFKIAGAGKDEIVVSPAFGKIHQIYVEGLDTEFSIKRDVINIRQALNNSRRAEKFIGGQMVDILLWFTDYHYFHAPVSGKIVELGQYAGSYNYNFKDEDWYKELAKHKRLCYVFKPDDRKYGLVAMIPVGFWGVGSCITFAEEGDHVKKGDLIGRFGYGGSSILLIFQRGGIDLTVPKIERDWRKVHVGMKIGTAQKLKH